MSADDEVIQRRKGIWITWEQFLRNRSMSAMLGVPLFVVSHGGGRFKRYWRCSVDTMSIIRDQRPDVVFAQNPSLALNYLLLLLRPFFRYRLVIDAHYGGIVAHTGSALLQRLLDFLNRLADFVIVTNPGHGDHVERVGGRPLICPDPLPDLGRYAVSGDPHSKSVFYICSYDIDEPYKAMLEAADLLASDGFEVHASGNYRRVGINASLHPNVSFTGFLPEDRFYERLYKSDVVVDLTDNEDCLVCGAYEAMVAERPLVTSDTRALRAYFNRGTVFTGHDGTSIAEAVRTAYRERDRLGAEIKQWKRTATEMQQRHRLEILTATGLEAPR